MGNHTKMMRNVLLAACLAVGSSMVARAEESASAPAMAQGQVVSVPAGLSTTMETPWPVKRISVTDPKIADVQVITPKQVLISGKTVGSTDVILWNKDEVAMHARVSVEIDTTAMKTELGKLFPRAKLDVRQSKDVLVVSGTLDQADEAQELHRFLDVSGVKYLDVTKVAGVQQVQIRIRIAEASRTALRMLGVNAGYTDGHSFGATNQDLGQFGLLPSAAGLGSFGDLSPVQSVTLFGRGQVGNTTLEAFVSAMAQNQYIRVMAEPTLVALSGQEANFLAGGEFPVPVPQNSGSGGTGGTTITIDYKQFGVLLHFKPTVLGDGRIRLHVAPEVSQLSDNGALQIAGFSVPAITTRRAETTLELGSGQTFGMAGLINQTVSSQTTKVPGLGEVPIIGNLFRSTRYQKGDTELLVLVTASLVEPSSTTEKLHLPGDLHITPNDWELYAKGQIEGKGTAKVAPVDGQALHNQGLDRLKGPGAWADYETPAGTSSSELASSPATQPVGSTEE